METSLSSEAMCQVVGQIEVGGFFEPIDPIYAFDETTVYSEGASDFIIQINGPLTKTVDIYLQYTDYLVDEIDLAYHLFATYEPPAPVHPYIPEQILLWITPPFNMEGIALNEWPSELPSLTEIWQDPTNPQVLIEGELVASIMDVFAGRMTAQNYLIGDEVYSVVMRPLLPHETPANFSIYPHEPTSFNLPFACTNLNLPELIPATTPVPTATPTLVAEAQTLRGRIIFSSAYDGNAEIYVMYADGTQLTRLTNHPGNDTEPVWSPDGQRIAFVSDRSGHNEIYVMNADGTEVTRLTLGASDKISPAWSPNGQQLAFVDLRNETFDRQDTGIYLINADGNNLISLPLGGTDELYPTWSIDGGHIIYQEGLYYPWELRMASLDATDIVKLGIGSEPSLSPNGHQLAYVHADEGQGIEVAHLISQPFSGVNIPIDLTPDTLFDYAPAWSPDGQRIVFISERDGNAELYVMNADGSNPIRLTYTAAAENSPDWTP
jgi:TolB protein